MNAHPDSSPHRIPNVRDDFTGLSDAGLVLAVARYRHGALAEAYRRHAGAVFGLAKRLLGDVAQSEEVVQEVFLRLWNSPDKFDPDRGSLRSFLLAAARRPRGRHHSLEYVSPATRRSRPADERRGGL